MRKTNIRIYSLHCHIYRAHSLSHYHTLILSHSTSFNFHCPSNLSFICTIIKHFHPLPLPHSTSSFYSWPHSPSSNFSNHCHLHQTFIFTLVQLSFIKHYHTLPMDALLKVFYSLRQIIRCHTLPQTHYSNCFIHCHIHQA